MPEVDDVNQKYFGDCYLMATLAGMADVSPDFVKSLFTDYGDGRYGVRVKNQFYTLDTSFNSYAAYQPGKTIWPTLLEKAYAEYRIETVGGTNYGGIAHGASVDAVLFDWLGRGNVNTNARGYEALNLAIDALAAGGTAVLGSDSNVPGLNSPHAYTVVHYDAATSMFTLRNPWGYQDGGRSGGYIDVSYHTLGAGYVWMVSTRGSLDNILLAQQPAPTLQFRPTLGVDDTGARSDDGITRDTSLAIGQLEPGAGLLLRIDGGAWTEAGQARFGDPTITAREGRHTYEVVATDGKGGRSPVSTSLTIDLDTRAPAAHAVTLVSPGVDHSTLQVTGMEPGNLWEVSTDFGRGWQAMGTADATGSGTFDLAAPKGAADRVRNGDFHDGFGAWRSDYDSIGLVAGRDGAGDRAIGFHDRDVRDTGGALDICRMTVQIGTAGDYRFSFDGNLSTRVHAWYRWDQIMLQTYVDGAPVGSRFWPNDSAGWQHQSTVLTGLTPGAHELSLRTLSATGFIYDVGLSVALDNLSLIHVGGALEYDLGALQFRQFDPAGNATLVANASTLDWAHLRANTAMAVMPA